MNKPTQRRTRTQTTVLAQPELALDVYLQALLAPVAEATLEDDGVLTESATDLNIAVASAVQPSLVNTAADEDLQVLFFRVGDLTLATPVDGVRRVLELNGALTRLPEQPKWWLGLLQDQGRKISVLHTTALLQGKRISAPRDLTLQPYRKILLSQRGDYGFACDDVLAMCKLPRSAVQWRTAPGRRRRWFLGTLIEHLCVLVDLSLLLPVKRPSTHPPLQ